MKVEIQRIRKGKGKKPTTGQMVTVNYKGSLIDGTVFDSSYKRNKPFNFIIGEGNVIKGWDQGVSKMKKGEKAKLFIPPELGYGAKGVPMRIPPNSTLIFDIELLDC